jgi:cell division septation protein DedD
VQKVIHLIIILFFTACGSNPDYMEVMVNKSIKVFSQDYHDKAENYTFKWEPPMDPNNETVLFDLKNDMLIFAPTVEGDYQIHLSIADISDEVVAEEMFYYRAVSETLDVAIITSEPEERIPEKTSVVINPKEKNKTNIKNSKRKKTTAQSIKQKKISRKTENVHFTIQVAAWPSLEQARTDQLELVDEGIDAYIQRHYKTGKDEVWYRVRVGNFSNKEKAIEIQKHIEMITGKKSWLDVISVK